MLKEGKFGFLEAYALMTTIMITKIFYTFPLYLITRTGTAAWYCTLISCAAALIFFGLLSLLLKRFPQKDLYQIFEEVLGKKLAKVVISVFSAYFLYYTGINLAEFVTILNIYSMPFTPQEVLVAGFLVVVAAMAYVGLEGIARVAYILFNLIIAGLFLILLLAIPAYNFDHLKPWFGYGIESTVLYGVVGISAYDMIIILAVIANSVHASKNFKKIGIASLVTAGAIVSISVACILAAFQYTAGSEYLSGLYQLSRIIYYSRFFQKVEAIFMFFWVFASVVTISLTFYISISSYCRTFNIKNHRPLLWPFLFLTFAITFIPENMEEIIDIHVHFIRTYSSVILIVIPVLVLILALIMRKRGGKANAA